MELSQQRCFYLNTSFPGIFAFIVIAIISLVATSNCLALSIENSSKNIFSGRPGEILVKITHSELSGNRLVWQLSAKGRTLLSGKLHLNHHRPEQPVPLHINLPRLAPAVILSANLNIKLITEPGNIIIHELNENIFIHAPNPFLNQSKMIRAIGIFLYDPQGDTANTLSLLDIPFTQIDRPESISHIKQGILIIGENTLPEKHSELEKFLLQESARGLPVLYLSSPHARIPISPTDDIYKYRLKSLALETTDMLNIFSPNKELHTWPGSDMEPANKIGLTNTPIGELVATQDLQTGWSWMEIAFIGTDARFIYLGIPLIESWNRSPVPRYLLLEIIKHLSKLKPM